MKRLVYGVCLALTAAQTHALTRINFSLDRGYTTSAGVFDASGSLIRTLWSAQHLGPGKHSVTWDDRDDARYPIEAGTRMQVRLLRHQVSYQWDGVIGNTSARFTGAGVHRSLFPPSSIAIVGKDVIYTVGYNELGSSTAGFSLEQPQLNSSALARPDAYAAWSLVASDGNLVYLANTGGLSDSSFVMALDARSRSPKPLPLGQSICLPPNAILCTSGRQYAGVVDLNREKSQAPTGLAVQPNGRVLAVAHGQQGVIRLFDKNSGTLLGEISIPKQSDASNQLACGPDGDLWVLERDKAVRFTHLGSDPSIAASITDLEHPLAVAVAPADGEQVLIADGGSSQQIKAYNREGQRLWSFGRKGGYDNDPSVTNDKLWFRFDATLERTGLAIEADGSFWVIDTSNDRMLHISAAHTYIEQLAYLPASYCATVDSTHPNRVFANYLEYDVPPNEPLQPGPNASWSLTHNWLAGLPSDAQEPNARNGAFSGLQSVVTLRNQRTYAMTGAHGRQIVLELPRSGPARLAATLPPPLAGETAQIMYEDGELGHADTKEHLQSVYRQELVGFDAAGNPQWGSTANVLAAVAVTADSPVYKGAFSGITGPRFPITSSDRVIFFDQSVAAADPQTTNGFHLGAVTVGARNWIWKTSRAGPFDEPGAFPTNAADPAVHYGGNMVWSVGRQIVYGYHGEGFRDPLNGKVGQANHFMHFYDDGLFIGQFGLPTTRAVGDADAGVAGNSFSNILVSSGAGGRLLFFHNDESQHGGVHRWTIANLESVYEMTATGRAGDSVTLQ
jgi:hypothetical protein